MRLPVVRLGLLSAAAVLLLRGGCAGCSSHSLRIFYTLFVDSSQDGAQYIVVVYVDDQLVARFDPTTRRMLPLVDWLLNVNEEDSHSWDMTSRIVNSTEQEFRDEFDALHNYHNSSRGFQSWQKLLGCELNDEGQKQGIYQYGCDGEDFISLDQKTLSWITGNVHAQETKRRWEAEPFIAQKRNHCLENKCIELLRKCVMYGNDSLLRKEPPVAEGRIQYKALETLVCRVYGFYPKEVNVTWREDGEVSNKNASSSGVLPNSDGTYHTSLSIEVDPEEKRDHYRCYVEHAGLPEPLIVAWEESAERKRANVMRLVDKVVAGVVALVALVAAVVLIGLEIFYITGRRTTSREISTTSPLFEMRPVLRDQDQRQQSQDQRQQDQDQRQQRIMMEDDQRTRMMDRSLGPSWNSY